MTSQDRLIKALVESGWKHTVEVGPVTVSTGKSGVYRSALEEGEFFGPLAFGSYSIYHNVEGVVVLAQSPGGDRYLQAQFYAGKYVRGDVIRHRGEVADFHVLWSSVPRNWPRQATVMLGSITLKALLVIVKRDSADAIAQRQREMDEYLLAKAKSQVERIQAELECKQDERDGWIAAAADILLVSGTPSPLHTASVLFGAGMAPITPDLIEETVHDLSDAKAEVENIEASLAKGA